MSGCLVFFSTSPHPNPQALLTRALHLTGSSRIMLAARSHGPDHGWRDYRERLHLLQSGDLALDPQPIDPQILHVSADPAHAPDLYQPDRCLYLILDDCPLGRRVADACAAIPQSTRGLFLPRAITLRAGWHDIFETSEHDGGALFARAFLSLQFDCPCLPPNLADCRHALASLPALNDIQRDLELPLGPLHRCAYWSF